MKLTGGGLKPGVSLFVTTHELPMLTSTQTQHLTIDPIPRYSPCSTKSDSEKSLHPQAPNTIINLVKLQSVVNRCLGACPSCRQKILRVSGTAQYHFATPLEIEFTTCDNKRKKIDQQIRYLNRKVEEMTITTNKDKLERRCKQQEIHHKRRKLTKLQSEYKWRTTSSPGT